MKPTQFLNYTIMRMLIISSIIALMAFTTTACHSARKFAENGDYDSAIEYCVKHLRGKKKKQDDLVRGLEMAYERAQDRDLRRLENLQAQNTLESWERAHSVALDIRDRQDLVEPLVPLRSKDGYIAHFEFVGAEKMVANAAAKASELMYAQAERLLVQAETGDRKAARTAYDLLEDLGRKYTRNYRDSQHLMSTALHLGASYTLFSVSNQSNEVLPVQVENKLTRLAVQNLDARWKKFDTSRDGNQKYHYRAKFILERIEVSPELVRENRYWDEKHINDGFEYVLDKRGNVIKDSLGNDMKRVKTAIVRADVLEINQRKTALVRGMLEVYDATGSQLLERKPITTEVVFDHLSVSWRGDERALSDKTRCNLGRVPAPFPSDSDLLYQASDQLQPMLADALRSSKAIM
jgi:hypothetical protein